MIYHDGFMWVLNNVHKKRKIKEMIIPPVALNHF